jgi:hypothetical protein
MVRKDTFVQTAIETDVIVGINRVSAGTEAESVAAEDPRDRFIRAVVRGRSFAEVGGLWGTVNERVSVAHVAGAASLAMVDVSTSDSPWWSRFDARLAALGVPEVRQVSGDVIELAPSDPTLRFDVVHCSGVLYHMPEPFQLLRALRTMTRGHLILSSSVTETEIVNEAGALHVPHGGALFLPALTSEERAVLAAHWWPVVSDTAIGLTCAAERWNLDDFGPWWWLPTTRALAAMCFVAGFDVVEVDHFWGGHAATLLLSARA